MHVSHVNSISVIGLEGISVHIETDLGLGLPNFTIVGLGDKAVEEAKERVKSAFKNSHLSFPQHRVTVNLAPADIKKSGSFYDLAIAVGIAVALELVDQKAVVSSVVVGELSLSGDIRSVSGILPAVLFAKDAGIVSVYVPEENAREAALVKGITVYAVRTFRDLYLHMRGEKLLEPTPPTTITTDGAIVSVDMAHIKGQAQVKRALEVAAAGGHNILMTGPPGSGKTLLARALCGILPLMTEQEVFDVTKLYSVSGFLNGKQPLIMERPFRSPHHTASLISLVGGGSWLRPGEISLAHRGVLFLDELPEFPRSSLESLRQPLEIGYS